MSRICQYVHANDSDGHLVISAQASDPNNCAPLTIYVSDPEHYKQTVELVVFTNDPEHMALVAAAINAAGKRDPQERSDAFAALADAAIAVIVPAEPYEPADLDGRAARDLA